MTYLRIRPENREELWRAESFAMVRNVPVDRGWHPGNLVFALERMSREAEEFMALLRFEGVRFYEVV